MAPNTSPTCTTLSIRAAVPEDAHAIAAIDEAHTGVYKLEHWQQLIVQCRSSSGIALVALCDKGLVGYVLGEVRAWEFGSPASGWIYAIGVAPAHQGEHIGAQLFDAASTALKQVDQSLGAIRTMVRRDDIALLRYFRSVGFSAGPFVELEVPL